MAKRTKADVESVETLYSGNRKVGSYVKFKDGTDVTLRNPSGMGSKYAAELRDGVRYTNDGEIKVDDEGNPLGLSNTQKSWRGGWFAHAKASAKAFKARKK